MTMPPTTIRLLPAHLVNQIAAGEVIERPAAALRELLQNSLDAGATRIRVMLERAGQGLIRITDNGRGIPRDQLPLALERHATSKLPEDRLDQITSFGFRGEALPAIASVSKLTLQSRSADSDEGWKIISQNGALSAPKPLALAQGTTVTVSDIFLNTPARLKFQKSQRSEVTAMRDVVSHAALSHPNCAFTLQNDGKTLLDLSRCESRAARLTQLWGQKLAAQHIVLDAKREEMHLTGILIPPAMNAPTRAKQWLLVNNRPVSDNLLQQAIYIGYRDVIPKGRHPILCLNLQLPPQDVDVNVHPAKSEVRFRDPSTVRGFVISAIQHALAQQGIKPVANLNAAQPFTAPMQQAPRSFQERNTAAPPAYLFPSQTAIRYAMAEAAPLPTPQSAEQPLGQALVQLFDTYIIAANDAGLVLVDQHAAHERLVYEQLKQEMECQTPQSQDLLIPYTTTLPAGEAQALLRQAEGLAKLGLIIDPFGDDTIALRAVPQLAGQKGDWESLLNDLAGLAAQEKDSAQFLERFLHEICASLACYGSVRAGRRLTREEMNALLRDIEATPNAWQCNHGRPTVMQLDANGLEKLFKRS